MNLMPIRRCSMLSMRAFGLFAVAAVLCLLALFAGAPAFAQTDQGAITGIVADPSGAPVPNVKVTLTSTDTGLVLNATTSSSGVYTFSPVKTGNYSVSATAAGFSTTTQQNILLHVQERLEADLNLAIGSISQQVEVTAAPPAMQTEDASVSQDISNQTINDTPLNGRNYVYIAHLSAGVTPTGSTRGGGTGDFTANGQSSGQNNFVLDGVDNNVNVVDYLNGSSYAVRPPPDALSEFRVQTANYSAEFGHSAGAVVNATIKSGTNQIHGDAWEYIRNTALDAKDWSFSSVPPYHENQFGATLGLPVIKNKVFWFGDVEANRISTTDPTNTYTVPTAKMHTGDFSDLLNATYTGSAAIQLYEPGTHTAILNDRLDLDPNLHLDPVALHILSLYPAPNTCPAGVAPPCAINNYKVNRPVVDNTFQFDTRVDWNISSKDQAFVRFSDSNEREFHGPPLGPILDGGTFNDVGPSAFLGQNTSFSYTHIFNETLTNEFRVGYNYGHFTLDQPNANTNVAAALGLGGIPFGPNNGGLPVIGGGTTAAMNLFGSTNANSFGTAGFLFTTEHQNIFQVLDNVTKVAGNHTLKFGVTIQYIRFSTLQPQNPRGSYTFNGQYTGGGTGAIGSGVADFLLNQINAGSLSAISGSDDLRWDNGAFAQDDWKVTRKLTLNLGLRWEDPTSYRDLYGRQANFAPTSPLGINSGTANYLIPITDNTNASLGPNFPLLAASNRTTVVNTPNQYLVGNQWRNFAPRVGFAYKISNHAVVRGGYGLFDGGLNPIGYGPSPGADFPFLPTSNFTAASCSTTAGVVSCPVATSNLGHPLSLETGFVDPISTGLVAAVTSPTVNGIAVKTYTPYSETYNLSTEYQITSNMTATVGYVGSQAHKTLLSQNVNNAYALEKNGSNISGTATTNAVTGLTTYTNAVRAFPGFGNIGIQQYIGQSSYNSLQAGVNRRAGKGLTFAANYTYAHNVGIGGGGVSGGGGAPSQNSPLVSVKSNIYNSSFDVRQRFTLNGNYELPVGKGRKFADRGGVVDAIIGGWASSLTFVTQTGQPITITSTNGNGFSAAAGTTTWAIPVSNPFVGGGTVPANNPSVSCPAVVHTRINWYNPCAFVNPLSGTAANIATASGGGTQVTGAAALPFFGNPHGDQIDGPGYYRMNMSLFKSFKVTEGKTLQFRTDIFNVLNTPSWGNPSNLGINSAGGSIIAPLSFQKLTPDARFFQFSLKFLF